MAIDRITTAAQTALFLRQIQNAGSALDKVQEQIASGKNANTYAGFGDKAQVLTATIAANARNDAYTNATKFAVTQADVQDTQLASLSSMALSLKKAVSDAVANNDATTLMTQAKNIFDQASAILNSKDANGDYIYSGGRTDVAPVTVSSLAALTSLGSVAGAFANGDLKKSVQVADGVSVSYGMTASGIATELMQALKDIAAFDASGAGNFNAATTLTAAQSNFLTTTIGQVTTVGTNLNATAAANGYVSNRLTDAQSQQASMNVLYNRFVSDIQDTNMAHAATQLSLNQTQLQAALQVTAGLHQLSLLNFLPVR
ncbi:MAG TPA: flagellin [Rhizomicrobium sp.]|nr:flagellin [Rhizomicrobium sp.]